MIFKKMSEEDINLCSEIVETFSVYIDNYRVEVGNYNDAGVLLVFDFYMGENEHDAVINDNQFISDPKLLLERLLNLIQ